MKHLAPLVVARWLVVLVASLVPLASLKAAPANAPTLNAVYATIPTSQTNAAYGVEISTLHYILQWTDNSTDEDFFKIQLKVPGYNSGNWMEYTDVPKDRTSGYFFLNLERGAGFPVVAQNSAIEWRVIACKGATTPQFVPLTGPDGQSAPSNSRSVAYDTSPQSGWNAPTGFSAGMVPGNDFSLRFNWTDTNDKEEGYELHFKASTETSYSGNSAVTFNFGATPADIGGGLEPGVTYNMKIRPYRATSYATSNGQLVPNAFDYGPFSNESTFTYAQLAAPTGLTATSVDENSIKLTWTDNSRNEGNYAIEFRTVAGTGSFVQYGTVAANSTTVTFDEIPGKAQDWRVKALYQGALLRESAVSNTVTHTLPFNAPTALTASFTSTSTSSGQTLQLNWTDNSLVEAGYRVLYRPTVPAGGTFAVLRTFTTPNQSSATIEGDATVFAPGSTYEFQVLALYTVSTQAFFSAVSNTASAATKDRITSLLSLAAVQGAPVSTTVTASNASVTFSATGLPPGLVINSTSGAITHDTANGGTGPTQSGLFNVTLSAAFGSGFTDTKTLLYRVLPAKGAPTTPLVVTARTIGTGTTATLPLSTGSPDTSLFADPDSEVAVRLATTKGNIDMILTPTVTPATVANFLAYVDAGDYNGVTFHRAPAGFVLQGGAFKPTTVSANTFSAVASRPSPLNEPGISNLVETIAMAKVGGDPNSATHDFFFNLGDNSANLDNQNGGFTVFGRAARNPSADSWPVVNSIAGLPKASYTINVDGASSGPYADWPMDATTAPSTMDNTKIVKINTATRIPVLSYAIVSNSNAAVLTPTITNGVLSMEGLTQGSSTLQIRATDLDGNTKDQTFTVTVQDGYVAPTISTQPTAQTKVQGQTATFTVATTGSGVTYQWKRNGVNLTNGGDIAGATTDTLTIANTEPADAGSFTVLVTNDAGFALSTAVSLTVQVPVTITTQPLPAIINFGSSTTFTVAATGDAPITYQWRKNNSSGTPENITTATSSSFTITNAPLTAAGDYSVVVSNPAGPVTSNTVSLTVNKTDTDGDGLFDDEELARTPPTSVTNTDSDADGFADGLEVGAGTNPSLATSKPDATTFYAQKDGAAVLNAIPFKHLLGAVVPNRLAAGDLTVPSGWFAQRELTNHQFASLLQRAKADGLITIATESGRRVVRYPAVNGEIVCYLATPISLTGDPACEVDLDTVGSSFKVAVTKQDFPANAVSWHGAYLCTVVLNRAQGYTGKNLTATWAFDPAASGYHLPTDEQWTLAGRAISPTYAKPGLAFPTGATAVATAAWFNQTTALATTKKTGSYVANRLGVQDLGGNVEEWVDSGPSATQAYTRGGSYADPAAELDNTADDTLAKTTISRQIGVRLALKTVPTPSISISPSAVFQRTGTPITLTATVVGAAPLTYQWLKNGVAIAGKTTPVLTLPATAITDAGAYSLKVTSNVTAISTSTAVPVALVQYTTPIPMVVVPALRTATLSAKVAGAPGQLFDYQWKLETASLVNGGTVAGATGPTLTMTTVVPDSTSGQGNTGAYTCTVSLRGQTALPSVDARVDLTVLRLPVLQGATWPNSLNIGRTLNVPTPFSSDPQEKPASFLITGLPPGLTYSTVTGAITGKPTKAGGYTVTVIATNAFGSSTSIQYSLIVNGLPAYVAGRWVGLVGRHVSNTLTKDLGGSFTLDVTVAGTYTLNVTLAGVPYRILGSIDAKDPALPVPADRYPTVTAVLPRAGLPTLRFNLTLNNNIFIVANGTAEEVPAAGGAATASTPVLGWANHWTATAVNGVSVGPANLQGFGTAQAPNPTMNVALAMPNADPNVSPQGFGFAKLTISTLGVTSIVGRLPDDTPFTSSGVIGVLGQVPVHVLLYGNTGSLHGSMAVTASSLLVGPGQSMPLAWRKKPLAGRNYPRGFDITPTPSGAKYIPLVTPTIIAGITATSPTRQYNSRLTFTNGGLGLTAPIPENSTATALVHHFIMSTASVPTILTDLLNNPRSVRMTTCNRTNGDLGGSFSLSDLDTSVTPPKTLARGVVWYGLAIPAFSTTPARGVGYFVLPKMPTAKVVGPPVIPATTILTSEKLSGSVILDNLP